MAGAGQLRGGVGHTKEVVTEDEEGAEPSLALALRVGGGWLKKGQVVPLWPWSSMAGWRDPEGGLGKAGDLRRRMMAGVGGRHIHHFPPL